MNKKRMNKIIKIFIISMTAIALTLSGRPPAMIYADQPGTPSGMGTMNGGGTAYKRLGYSLMYSGYTTSVATGDGAVTRSTDTESSYYNYEPKIINDGGTLRYLRGSRYVPKAGGGWTWNNQEVAVTPAGFTRNNLVRGRSLLDNMYLEPGVNRDTLDTTLVNGGTAWLNSIISVRTKANGHVTMYTGRLWGEGKANFNVPARVYTTSAGALAAAGWSTGTVKALKGNFDIAVSMPKIDDTPPDITFNPYSDGTWRNYNRTVTATAKDAGSGVKRMRWRIETNETWGGWSHWQNTTSLAINLSNTGKQRVEVQAQDNFDNTGGAYSGYFHIDKTAPGGSIAASPASWTNGNVTLAFTGTDTGGSGVRRVRQSGGSWVNGSTTTRTVSSNGTYSFEVEDNAGNTKTVSREVTNIDKTAPTANAPVIHDARYVSENDYWYKPGDSLRVDISGSDSHSGIRDSYLNLYKSGSDNRALYRWSDSSFSEFSTATYSIIRQGTTLENGTTKRYRFNASVKPNSNNQDLGVYSYFRDNAGSTVGYINSGLRVRVDGTAPTVSASPSSSAWGNTNANVSLTYSDSRSGVQTKQYAWSTSTATPSSWSNYTSQVSQANDGVWYLHYRTVDNVGNVRTGYFGPYRIDKTLPNGTITGNPTSWTNQNVTLTFNATDTGGSGVKRVRQSGGTWVNGSTTSRTVTANGTYSFEVEDNAGNKRTVTATVNRIDKGSPEMSLSHNPDGIWTNGDVTTTISARDLSTAHNNSGVRRYRIRPKGSAWGNWSYFGGLYGTETELSSEWFKGTRTITSNGTYEAQVEDRAGNAATQTFTVDWIDKILPGGYVSGGNPSSWTNQNATINFQATDGGGSGVRRIRIDGGIWISTSRRSLTVTKNGTYNFEVEDHAGNVRTVPVTVNRIDKEAPDGTITGNPTSWTNKDVTLTFNATDTGGSGVRRVRQSGGTWVDGSTTSRTVTGNGTYSFEVEDNAGNTKTVSTTVTRIDKDRPAIALNHSPSTWTNGNVTTTIRVSDFGRAPNYAGLRRLRMKPQGGSWSSWSNYGAETELSSAWFEKTRTITSNGTYEVQVEDRAGNTSSRTFTVDWIDREAPNGTITGNPTSWTNQNVTLRFNATDTGGSGVKRVRVAGGTWVNGSTTTQIATANGTYSFEVEDNAGNTRTVSVTVNRIDKAVPNGTITGNPTNWQNTNATLTFTATDTGGSGVKRVRKPDGTWVNGSTTSQVVTQNGTYTFRVEDNAGNIRDVSVTVTLIDKTVPDASSTQTPTAWTNGNVTITWNASATGSPLQRVRTHNGSSWSGWTTISGTTRTQTQVVSSNGTYHFQVQDAAGNVRQISRIVSNIDKTVPNMTVTSLNTDWTNRSIGIRTTVNDRGDTGENQHISGVQRIRMRPQGGTWGAWRTFSSTSERSSADLNDTWTIDENGTYEWEVEDRAGNSRTASYTVTNIDLIPPATSGSFTPDGWTNQTITITWVAERTGNPGSPLDAYRYDRGNGDWTGWQNAKHADAFTVTQDVTENGTYQFDIRDKAGNVARSSVTVTKHDIVLPVGQITARYDRSERDDHVDYTSDELVDMIDSNRVTVDVTGVEDLGISGVDFVTIEEQRRIGYGSDWMTVREIDYDWPDPYNTTSQTYAIDVAHAQDTRFILTVTDRAGNESSRVASNVVRQSVLQFIDFRITDVVNPNLSEEDLAAIRASDFEDVVELTAGTNVTFDVTYQLRHLDTVDELSGKITIKTISDDRTDTETIQVNEDVTGHNQHVTFTNTFTVPQGAPKGSEITIGGNLEAKLANGTTHEITYPGENNLGNQGTDTLGEVGSHIEEFFRFRIVR